MNTELYAEYGIDCENGVKRFMGREEVYKAILFSFIRDENYEKLKTALENGDCRDAFKAAHTLKGVCGNLSIKGLEDRFSKITDLLRHGKIEKCKALMNETERMYLTVTDFLKRAYEEECM